MNIADLIVGGIIVAVLIYSIVKMVKNKKAGKCNCGCSSGNCNACTKNVIEENIDREN